MHGGPSVGNKDEGTESYTVEGTRSIVPFLRKHTREYGESNLYHAKSIPPVQFYAIDSGINILHVMKPSVIIVYHPHMTFVRKIEIYKSENPSKALKVYFLFYEDSTEVQKFERIDAPVLMKQNVLSCKTHQLGRQVAEKCWRRKCRFLLLQTVIVDMREFKSSLPNVLHQKGMHIIPVVLEVGDYVLSSSICVERKSIPDLFQSFASGRLYHQVEIFSSLKTNQDEPDEIKATRVGVPSEDGVIENDVRAENYNTSAVEFLRRLPGVTDANCRALMDGCNSLADLALLPVEKLAELMGGQKAARTLRDFLDAKYPTMM